MKTKSKDAIIMLTASIGIVFVVLVYLPVILPAAKIEMFMKNV